MTATLVDRLGAEVGKCMEGGLVSEFWCAASIPLKVTCHHRAPASNWQMLHSYVESLVWDQVWAQVRRPIRGAVAASL